jgi:RNA polymerase-binding transcription factor DksA
MSSMTIAQPGLMQRRAQLESRWRARLQRVTELSLAYHDAAQAGTAIAGRAATARRTRELARRTVAERQALAEIEAALDRIARGDYGWCEQCHAPISAALLAYQPQARYCTGCDRPAGERAAKAMSAPYNSHINV